MMCDTRRYPAQVGQLPAVTAFVEACADRYGLVGRARYGLLLALEEAFVNVCRYAYAGGAGLVEVTCEADDEFVLTIADEGRPFDALSRPDPVIVGGILDRPVGGLGIHFIRTVSSGVAYRREDGRNILRMTFTRESGSQDPFLQAAIEEARQGLAEGGIPIGSVIVHRGNLIGRGHNRRVQKGSPILHGEMDALENAGRQPASVYQESVLYTTLSPCPMCTGAILLYGIPRVVIGENRTFMGEEALLRSRGVTVEVLQDADCIELMQRFIASRPELWNEDIGEPPPPPA